MKRKNKLLIHIILLMMLVFAAFVKPAAVNAEEETVTLDYKVTSIEDGLITVEAVAADESTAKISKIYVDTTIGSSSKFTKETYSFKDDKAFIDLQYLKGKKAKLVIYSDTEKKKAVTLEIAAKAKPAAVYDKFNEKLNVTVNGKGIDLDNVICIMNNKTASASAFDFTDYYKKGASGLIYVKGEELSSEITTVSTTEIKPESKEIKIKIPAQKKAPNIKINVESVSFKLPKGCTYEIIGSKSGIAVSVASESAVSASKEVDITKVLSGAGINLTEEREEGSKESALIEVYRNGTQKAVPSRIAEIYLPVQKTITAETIATLSGVTFENVYNKSKLKMTGVSVTNHTNDIYQVAAVGKDTTLDKLDLLSKDKATKIKWKTLKPGKSAKYTTKTAPEGTRFIYRIKGVKKTKNTELVLPSVIIMDPRSVKIDKAPARIVNMVLSSTPVEGAGTASGTSISIALITDAKGYVYTVGDKEVKSVKIGTLKSDINGEAIEPSESKKVTVKAKQWVTVYAYNDKNEIIAFGCKKVSKDMVY